MDEQFDIQKKSLFTAIEELVPEIFKLSDYLADHPELGGKEHN